MCVSTCVCVFGVFDCRHEFGYHIYKMSEDARMMFWGGSFSRPIAKTIISSEPKSLIAATRAVMFDYEVRGGDALKSMFVAYLFVAVFCF